MTGTDLALPGSISETALDLPAGLSFEDWKQGMQELGRATRAHQWWLGDALNYGALNYGEKYAEGVELTGLDLTTLTDYAYVARHVEISVRNENLSWSHHKQIASLGAADQDRWLTAAEANDWSKNQLRKEINGAVSDEPVEHCPTCGRRLPAGQAT